MSAQGTAGFRWVVACGDGLALSRTRFATEAEARAVLARLAEQCAPAVLFEDLGGNAWARRDDNARLMPAIGRA